MLKLLTNEHFEAFGRITYQYATMEVCLKHALCGMLHLGLQDGLPLFAPYSAYNLASVTKATAQNSLKEPWRNDLIKLTNKWFEFTNIRTCVAHHRWRNGTRPDSIRSTYADVKTGTAVLKGFSDDERDYTIAELFCIADELARLAADLFDLLDNSGLEASIRAHTK